MISSSLVQNMQCWWPENAGPDLRLHPSAPWGLCDGVVVSRPEECADGLPNIRRRQPECLEFCLADRESMYCATERPSCDALWEIMAECFWSFRRREDGDTCGLATQCWTTGASLSCHLIQRHFRAVLVFPSSWEQRWEHRGLDQIRVTIRERSLSTLHPE